MIGNNIWTDDVRANLLHIFPQTIYHGEAKIHGSPEALTRLATALLEAAKKGQADEVSARMMASDGEGYRVIIRAMSDQQMEDGPLPYSTPGLPWENERCWNCPADKEQTAPKP